MGETRTGAQIIWECLVREGVTTVFGYPGGAILPAYDAMLDFHSVSDTAEHGDYTGGPRVVTEATRAAMRQMLDDIQSGEYAKSWMDEYAKGQPWFAAERDRARHHPIEEVGARLRAMMPFLDPVDLEDPARV